MSDKFRINPDRDWCEVCHSTGVVPCLCGGDACACGMEQHDCQHCDSEIEAPDEIDALAAAITESIIAEVEDARQ